MRLSTWKIIYMKAIIYFCTFGAQRTEVGTPECHDAIRSATDSYIPSLMSNVLGTEGQENKMSPASKASNCGTNTVFLNTPNAPIGKAYVPTWGLGP